METLKRLGRGILGIGAAILGSTIYIAMLGVMIFSLPLNVIAIMHLWGYEWWGALMLSVFIGFVPLLRLSGGGLIEITATMSRVGD